MSRAAGNLGTNLWKIFFVHQLWLEVGYSKMFGSYGHIPHALNPLTTLSERAVFMEDFPDRLAISLMEARLLGFATIHLSISIKNAAFKCFK